VDENLPTKLKGDDLRLKQVLNNLLSNAFKYTQKGQVTFSVGLAVNEKNIDGSLSLLFCVQDTGLGIKAENLKSLFTSYSRFDSKTNRFIEGTGLGLAISKNLVELMGGRIQVESKYRKGSIFSCIIPQVVVDPTPLGREASNNLANFREAPRQNRNKFSKPWQYSHMPHFKVLVVDDVQTNLRLAEGLLRKRYGLTVDCASSGKEAVDALRDGSAGYKAIFMDHMMPGMDGIEALRRIRSLNNDNARSVPVIILTANALAGNEKMFLEHGFQDFLAKPIDPLKLDAVIHKWLKDARQEIRPNSPRRRWNDLSPQHPNADTQEKAEPEPSSHLRAVEGLDLKEGIWRCGGEALFLEVLRSYATGTPALMEQMEMLLKTDLAGYGIIAHGLKGASYGVGAKTIGDMAKALEEAAVSKNQRAAREGFPLFREAVKKLLGGIDAMLRELEPDSTDEASKPMKPAPDPEVLTALGEASLSCSLSAMEKQMQKLEQYRYQIEGELITRLRECVDSFDYAAINQLLAEYASRRPGQ
jgi:CheY-like chemotaxis protein/HPt (histidine-containing phosphotransfer) domain-containing protein